MVFDIGGVLARICHTWQEVALHAGVATVWESAETIPLTGFPPLDAFQMKAIDLETYLQELSQWAGCDLTDALRIHNGILVDEYPEALDLVQELQRAGTVTGCLSNTNAPHWEELTSPRFPAIAALERKMASHLVGINKPDPAIFLLYAESNGFRPDEIVFFDDYPKNVESALNVGFRAHRIDPAGDTVAQMRGFLQFERTGSE